MIETSYRTFTNIEGDNSVPSGAAGVDVPAGATEVECLSYLSTPGAGVVPVTWYFRHGADQSWHPFPSASHADVNSITEDRWMTGFSVRSADRIAPYVNGSSGTFVLENKAAFTSE